MEYRSTAAGIAVGKLIRTRGASWRVQAIDGQTVILEAAEAAAAGPDGASAGPVVLPDPLGDKPLTLEVLAEV